MVDTIKAVVDEIWRIYSHRTDKKREVYTSIEAIYRAANRTRFVIASNNYQAHTPNAELSDLWVEAATAVRELDDNLYERLLQKSEYWADPRNWDIEMVSKARLYIDDIIEDANRILRELSNKN